LHRQPELFVRSRNPDRHSLQVLKQRRSGIPGHIGAAGDDVVAVERAHRNCGEGADSEPLREGRELGFDAAEDLLIEVHQIHLVDGHGEVRNAEEPRRCRHAGAIAPVRRAGMMRITARCASRRPWPCCAVLLVAGRVGDDELRRGVWKQR
jgi:hypothetical protein